MMWFKFAQASLLVTACATAWAAPSVEFAPAPEAVQALGPYQLISTHSSFDNTDVTLAAGYTLVDERRVECTNAKGCHIGQESAVSTMFMVGNWAICLSVDGVRTTCQLQGQLCVSEGEGCFISGSARGFSARVTEGFHTVRTEVYTSTGATLFSWQTDHRVYKP